MDEVSNENTEPVEENSSDFSTVSDNNEVALKSYGQAVLTDERNQGVAEQ